MNVPDGEWMFKSTASGSVFQGFSDNVIPMCKNVSGSGTHGWSENTQIGFSGSCSATINTIAVATASASKGANVGSTQWSTNVTANHVFIPALYGMDLTLVQQKEKSGTITVWLEKVG